MKNIYDEIGQPSKKNFRKICKLVEPLKNFLGIDRFWRNSHREDGSYSVLGNCPDEADLFFGQELYRGHPYFRNPRFFQSGFTLPELMQSREYEETQGRLGSCHHVLIHIEKVKDGFVEYGFATSNFRPGFEMVYLNHLKPLQEFIKAFEQTPIIQEAEECRVDIVQWIGPKYHEKPNLASPIIVPDRELSFLIAIESDPTKREGLLSLTKGERECLRHYFAGHSTQEIAKKLFRSPRTIETHLERAKAKLGVHSRSALFEVLSPFHDVL